MSTSWSFFSATVPPPSLLSPQRTSPSLHINTRGKIISLLGNKAPRVPSPKPRASQLEKLSLLLQYGAFWASVEAPSALAVTGNNMEEDLTTALISGGIVVVLYLLVLPPIIMNWMRLRWFKRKLLEMYLQFMCAFIFFPGLMLWAPFLNFRKFPRDPTMKYPWSTPKDEVPL